jgi:Icc-related predicted phosphoesterase
MPEGDVLVHAGDLTMGGRANEILQLNRDLGYIKNKFNHIVIIPGNHDHFFQENPKMALSLISNAHVLIDQAITLDGVKFYGSPWQTWFYDWAFNFPEDDSLDCVIAAKKWEEIPEDTDVLITHGPPYNMLDKVERYSVKNVRGLHVGCPALAKRVDVVKPKLHVFGHIHESYGRVDTDDTIFINAAICTLQYKPYNEPFVVEI